MSARILDIGQEPEKTVKWNSKRLIFQRKTSGLTHKQLAEALGVPQKQIECMENCTCIPSDEILEMLASFFDVPGDYFGVEALISRVESRPSRLSPQDERQKEARARLVKQRRMLRTMMRIAGFQLNCTGLNSLSKAIRELNSDTCKYVNGEMEMPPDTLRKVRVWFASIQKETSRETTAG